MRRRVLAAFGWLALQFLRVVWRLLSLLGSRWARKKLDTAHADSTRNPVLRTIKRRRAGHPNT